jgi:hypothetical protein
MATDNEVWAASSRAYTGTVLKAIVSAVRMWWWGCAGYRLTPWRSPYLRWRVETYSGMPAGTLRLKDFVALFSAERGQIGHYLRWLGEMRGLASERRSS